MDDTDFMRLALQQARAAAAAGEVPVGAVLVKDGVVIGTGRNAPIQSHDPTAHAEIVALREGAAMLVNYRLEDCELFVTLEPCAMCAGAMLHSRLKRVVFGATDPKTGAAGSVLNLFDSPRLNHHTQVQGGVLAEACGVVLQDFFRDKRELARAMATPLREDALRTPDERFAHLPGYPWSPHYVCDLPSLAGLRLHYLDEAPGAQTGPTYLCVHGHNSWSYLYRKMIPALLEAGHRVVVPDLIGFGKSDKPKKPAFHNIGWHRQLLGEFVQWLGLRDVVLVTPPSGVPLWQPLVAADTPHFRGLETLDEPADLDDPEYAAPYPDRGHTAGPRALADAILTA